MSRRFLESFRRPQRGEVQLDRGHFLAPDLRYAWLFHSLNLREEITGKTQYLNVGSSTGPAPIITREGAMITTRDNQQMWSFSGLSRGEKYDRGFTILAIMKTGEPYPPGYTALLCTRNPSFVGLTNQYYGSPENSWDLTTPSRNGWGSAAGCNFHRSQQGIIAASVGPDQTTRVFANGRRFTASSGTFNGDNYVGNPWTIGYDDAHGVGGSGFIGTLSLLAILNRQLQFDEMARWASNPYEVFRGRRTSRLAYSSGGTTYGGEFGSGTYAIVGKSGTYGAERLSQLASGTTAVVGQGITVGVDRGAILTNGALNRTGFDIAAGFAQGGVFNAGGLNLIGQAANAPVWYGSVLASGMYAVGGHDATAGMTRSGAVESGAYGAAGNPLLTGIDRGGSLNYSTIEIAGVNQWLGVERTGTLGNGLHETTGLSIASTVERAGILSSGILAITGYAGSFDVVIGGQPAAFAATNRAFTTSTPIISIQCDSRGTIHVPPHEEPTPATQGEYR